MIEEKTESECSLMFSLSVDWEEEKRSNTNQSFEETKSLTSEFTPSIRSGSEDGYESPEEASGFTTQY